MPRSRTSSRERERSGRRRAGGLGSGGPHVWLDAARAVACLTGTIKVPESGGSEMEKKKPTYDLESFKSEFFATFDTFA